MKTIMTLAIVAAAGIFLTTGCCSTCKKDGADTKTAMSCSGACCSDPAKCAKCCTDAAGCAKCCKKS